MSRNSFDASLISNNVKCPKTLLVDKKKAVLKNAVTGFLSGDKN